MSSLRSLQEELKKLLFVGQSTESTSLWGGKPPKHLEVYRNNVRSNWIDTLEYDFPLTRKQFTPDAWIQLQERYFAKYPPAHWELNASVKTLPKFLETQKAAPYVKELADYEWYDLQVFIDRSAVRRGRGVTNPTAVTRVYQHQIFYWVEAGAQPSKPPPQKPEVLIFYRDSRNTCHIQEADPLMLILLEHFRKPGAKLEDAESVRSKLLPNNHVPLRTILKALEKDDLILL